MVVVVGGSMGLTGAPAMAALSAARSGAGYVQVVAGEPQRWSAVLIAAPDPPMVLKAGVAGSEPASEGRPVEPP